MWRELTPIRGDQVQTGYIHTYITGGRPSTMHLPAVGHRARSQLDSQPGSQLGFKSGSQQSPQPGIRGAGRDPDETRTAADRTADTVRHVSSARRYYSGRCAAAAPAPVIVSHLIRSGASHRAAATNDKSATGRPTARRRPAAPNNGEPRGPADPRLTRPPLSRR